MKVEILYIHGCPNQDLADRRVHEVLDELGIQAEVVHFEVNDEETAQELRFPGSPTIRVNGVDVAPYANGEPFGRGCRVYTASSGLDGAPDKATIRSAIERHVA